jgi:transposase
MDDLIEAALAARPATPTYVREGQRTTVEQRIAVVALHKDGRSNRHIAKHVRMSRTTVADIIARWRATGSPGSGARSGRPKCTDDATDDAIVEASNDDPLLTPRLVARKLELTCSPRTISNRLDDAGLHGRVARQKRDRPPHELRLRLSFAEGYKHLDWTRVMCADEKYFYLHGHAHRQYVRRPVGEAFNPAYTVHKIAHPDYVPVWACISAHGQGDLVFLDGPLDGETYGKLMRDYLPLAADKAFTFGSSPWYYLHDNPTVHRGPAATRALFDAGATVLSFPPYSPDLNVIENMWAYLARKVDTHRCEDKEELKRWIQQEWDDLKPEYFRELFASYPRRCQAVINANGLHTKY